jgi:type II secretory pathway pseudopilin PulG
MKSANPRLPTPDSRLSNSFPTFPPSHLSTLNPLSPNCYLLSPVKLNAAAFSLTEVVIALGIFAVSMVGVLALFPVASSAGRESSEETQAAIIAQTVIGDLRASSSALGATNGWLVNGNNTFGNFLKPINLNQANNYAIAYNIKLRDLQDSGGGAPQIGPPIALKALATVTGYSNAVNTAGAIYLSLIQTRPVATLPGLASVRVEISTPANVALTNRRVYSFSTLIGTP